MSNDPAEQLALWADQLRAMAAHGLRFVDNPYDEERYHKITEIALKMLALATGDSLADVEPLRDTVLSHTTPFAVGDAAVIDDQARILLIRRADNGLWAMPGGALDVGETAAEGVAREALEETGVTCEAVGLVGIFDSRFCGTKSRHHLYQIVFLCQPTADVLVEQASHPHEVLETAWFAEAELPNAIDPGHVSRIPIAFQVYRGERTPFFD
ncbi:MAG TPA: NUDIX hydrolase N-terminal domain-containing protein [Caldilineaceae bacterium]|nr:NUDIX hydrolase N-terminal domain-containing protein [Caldilineaceae bacterium]